MKELGVGILGYGFIGRVHTYAYRNLDFFYDPPPARIRLVGACTSRPETAERAKADGGFEFTTTSAAEVISREDIDIVNICTPNHLHKDELLAAMAAGKHIYCDKPLTGTLADARDVEQALPAYSGTSQMTLNNRFCLAAMRAKQMIDEGYVGELTQFRAGYFHSGSVDPKRPMGWKQEAAAGGGVITDMGSHIVDLVDWLIGPIAEVQADTRILYPERPRKDGTVAAVEAEDSVTILARLAAGASGVIEASKIATGTNDELRVEIHGDRGAIRFNTVDPNSLEAYSLADPESPMGGMRGWRRIDTMARFPKPGGWPGPKFAIGWMRSHVHSLHNFVTAVVEGRQTEPSLAAGVRLQHMLHVVQESARERVWREVGA